MKDHQFRRQNHRQNSSVKTVFTKKVKQNLTEIKAKTTSTLALVIAREYSDCCVFISL